MLQRQHLQSVRPLVENLSSGSNNCSFLVLEYFHKWKKLMKMKKIDKEMKKIDQKYRKSIKIVKIHRLVQISGNNTHIPRRKPKNPDLVKKTSAGNAVDQRGT